MQTKMQGMRPSARMLLNCRKPTVLRCVASSSNGAANGSAQHSKPSPAETARTITDLMREGCLSTISADGTPMGTPVSFTLDKTGTAWVALAPNAPEVHNLKANPKCSLMVQPAAFPARAVASVSLLGSISVAEPSESGFRLNLDKALYFGGLDESSTVQEVGPADFMAAEPDVLRTAANDLVKLWNEERAEDLYRIVSHQLHVPLTQMVYAELLWVDRLGMYVRTEVEGREPVVVRVGFYRPVLDERDARSVITMAAQIAWEADRTYTPVTPASFSGAANN